jgi:hypothetical protein
MLRAMCKSAALRPCFRIITNGGQRPLAMSALGCADELARSENTCFARV